MSRLSPTSVKSTKKISNSGKTSSSVVKTKPAKVPSTITTTWRWRTSTCVTSRTWMTPSTSTRNKSRSTLLNSPQISSPCRSSRRRMSRSLTRWSRRSGVIRCTMRWIARGWGRSWTCVRMSWYWRGRRRRSARGGWTRWGIRLRRWSRMRGRWRVWSVEEEEEIGIRIVSVSLIVSRVRTYCLIRK